MSQNRRKSLKNQPCVLCGRQDDCNEKFGEKKTYSEHDMTLHYYCLLLSSGIWQRGEEDEGIYGFLVSDIKKELNRAQKLKCNVCKNRGASIGCVYPKCKRSYHYPCGVERECVFQFMGDFRSYCWEHRPVQKVSSSQASGSAPCTICLENVIQVPSYRILCGPCCKTSWFHRECLQYQALSAGLFFFRCTVCNNKEKFQAEMLRMGIHIPERDASWELEENAFQELLERYQRCDVEKCICRNGREYNNPDGKWEIVRCQCCGSRGTHKACTSTQQLNKGWECAECKSIVCTPGKRPHPSSLGQSEKRRCLSFGMEQPSPKCPRLSSTPRRKVLLKQIRPRDRPISDILHELRLQINSKSICTLRIPKESLWSSSISCFRQSDFSPSSTLWVKFSEHNLRKACKQPNGSISEYFSLLLNAIQNSTLMEGTERKNLTLNPDAMLDNLYYEAGRMVAAALVHGGPAPGFFSNTLFGCLVRDPQHVQPVLEDVADPNVAQAILNIQSCSRIGMLKSVILRYYDYLQKTGSLRLVQTVSDKDLIIKDILAHHVIHRVQEPLESFKEGLKTLGVLEKIQAHPSAFWSILCLKPEKLTAKVLAELFTITYPGDFTTKQQSEVQDFWTDYLDDTEEGKTSTTLEDILNFATGLDSIPLVGFDPQPNVHFNRKVLPRAHKNINCMELPVSSSYAEFRKSVDQAICVALGKA
ncbi:G2/M phase-specific E3 ubiquitin-protein ligase [Rhinophrynus dorsalis]